MGVCLSKSEVVAAGSEVRDGVKEDKNADGRTIIHTDGTSLQPESSKAFAEQIQAQVLDQMNITQRGAKRSKKRKKSGSGTPKSRSMSRDKESSRHYKNEKSPRRLSPKGKTGSKRVNKVLKQIKMEPLEDIAPRETSKIFVEKLHAYLNCRKRMDERYNEIDELQELAKFELEADSGGIRRKSGKYKKAYRQQSVSGKPVKNIGQLYEAAERASPIFNDLIVKYYDAVRQSIPDAGSHSVSIDLPPLKSRERTIKKANDDYSNRVPGPGISYVYDIVRGCVMFSSKDHLMEFVQMLKDDPAVHIVQAKNRFCKPTLTGYRDFNIQFQLEINGTFKHICELQFITKASKLWTQN